MGWVRVRLDLRAQTFRHACNSETAPRILKTEFLTFLLAPKKLATLVTPNTFSYTTTKELTLLSKRGFFLKITFFILLLLDMEPNSSVSNKIEAI